jgi:hypothetical protein
LDTDAIETKQKLEEKGSPVKIGHIQNDQIKNNTIVQLVNTEGYIKYWLYTSTVTRNNEKFAELYNGKDFVQIPLKHFKNCFSGIILEIIGTENDLTPTEIVKEIYDTKLKNLQDNINYHNDLLITANYLKCIGIALTMIIPIIYILIAILTLAPEPIISKGTAIFLGILAIIFWLGAALTFAIGVYMEGVSTTCKNDYINEKEDLTSYNM